MAKRTIPCRVCGKMFIPCNKPTEVLGAFNYHGFACSPECGLEYINRVEAARAKEVETENRDKLASLDDMKIDTIEQINEVPIEPVENDSSVENNLEYITTSAETDYRFKKNKRREG